MISNGINIGCNYTGGPIALLTSSGYYAVLWNGELLRSWYFETVLAIGVQGEFTARTGVCPLTTRMRCLPGSESCQENETALGTAPDTAIVFHS